MGQNQDPSFASRLKELREGAGLTQAALAERAGMHKLGVAKLEQGLREPTWATVRALAKALGVTCLAFDAGDGQSRPANPASAQQGEQPAGKAERKSSTAKKPARGQGRKRK